MAQARQLALAFDARSSRISTLYGLALSFDRRAAVVERDLLADERVVRADARPHPLLDALEVRGRQTGFGISKS